MDPMKDERDPVTSARLDMQFSVAGMSSTSSHSQPWSNSTASTSTFGDSLTQSRSHYQSGYLMSASQANVSSYKSQLNSTENSQNQPQSSQRPDEIPIVPTKAKMNHSLLRGSASDFGRESLFESSRSRQKLTDEDAPPIASVNDIPNETHFNPNPRFLQKSMTADSLSFGRQSLGPPSTPQPAAAPSTQQPLYIIVFGYPPDKYSQTVEYFKSLGDTTEPDSNLEIVNCFRIGYRDPGDAMRAVRKNGEVLGGTWMVGAKWADASQAESVIGQPVVRPVETSSASNAMAVDEPSSSISPFHNVPTVGTPIKLAPSSSAFRKPGSGDKPPLTPQNRAVWTPTPGTPGQASPTKGVLGQVSDLIFGW